MNNKKLKIKLLVATLVLIAGALCMVGVYFEAAENPSPASTAATVAGQGPQYEGGEKRDPFIPFVTNDGQIFNVHEEEETYLNLEGIIFDDKGQSMAIINGQVLRKNDTVGNIKIMEIRKDSVVYVKDGTLYTLETKKEE